MIVSIKCHPDFDFFLSNENKGKPIVYPLLRRANVKDVIESFGIPHTEVGQILFNGQDIDFTYIPAVDGVLEIHPIHPPCRVLEPAYLRPEPLEDIRFIADVNVIRLGKLLILAGFDVDYHPTYSDAEIARIASAENRIVLTRDTALLKRSLIVFGKRIRANLPYRQLVEVIRFYGLEDQIRLFSRCTACNIPLVKVAKDSVMSRLEPKTKRYYNRFYQCPKCENVFWKGSHNDHIRKTFSTMGLAPGEKQTPSGGSV